MIIPANINKQQICYRLKLNDLNLISKNHSNKPMDKFNEKFTDNLKLKFD